MKVLITGEQGFIGKNLSAQLNESEEFSVLPFTRNDSINTLQEKISGADLVVHLAGVNRPKNNSEFKTINCGLTESICQAIRDEGGREIPLILASSTQAKLDNPYGKSKYAAEVIVEELFSETSNPVAVYQLPSVFGRWCKPNYNSVVATFCHNIANGLPIKINDSKTQLTLVYIDDVITDIIRLLNNQFVGISRPIIRPEYSITLGDLARQIEGFKENPNTSFIENIDKDFNSALYSTYLSYLSSNNF
jgi:UDP-2-acetamido-2,6-beta-L-arabino-hexul-4-ose reductase